MQLIVQDNINVHVSKDTVKEFENSILDDSILKPAKPINKYYFKLNFLIYRILRKFGCSTIRATKKKYLIKSLFDKKHIFAVMMALDEAKYKPYAFNFNHCRSIYLFDAWPKDYNAIKDFCSKYKISYLFVTSLQSTWNLKKNIKNTEIYWIPEGISPELYKHYDYEDKNIDVLALGRKFDKYHNEIVDSLRGNNRIYFYEKIKGELIFSSREDFIEGLARSKISMCFPSSITHPERAGDISTMTIRYLQSMCSKCLVLGHAPQEMVELFGYNPVIEINYNNPVEQIFEILTNYSDYIPLIEKNYKEVFENHTWEKRWNTIKNIYTQ